MLADSVPDRHVDPAAAAAWCAVARGARSFREVAYVTGRSLHSTFYDCCEARSLGLIAWEPQKAGTLRTNLRRVR